LACVEGGVASALERVNEEIAFQASVRKDIAATLENYTCVDDSLNSTADITTSSWLNPLENKAYQVHIKHERVASKIHLIQDFITPEECEAMEKQAASTLHRATVADGKGGSQLSENRKAMQAGITVPWNTPEHPISKLSRRVYDYTNHVLDLDIAEHGQEDLMSIQYFGRGRNDTEPDRYTPHCDGDCTGAQHKIGTRVATMVMYCKTADSGGHTNFRNAGVHVKPVPQDAIFFSYIDPETHTMDTGFTEHSGCPVFEGEKKIVTQWIRYGVSVEEPWTAFNTLGIKIKDLQED
jgi:2OG-Fe(II) oxygenase superfamily